MSSDWRCQGQESDTSRIPSTLFGTKDFLKLLHSVIWIGIFCNVIDEISHENDDDATASIQRQDDANRCYPLADFSFEKRAKLSYL